MIVMPDKVERLPLADVIPYARNSRTHSADQVSQLAKSMREFGFTNPVLIDEHNTLIAGHGRVLAAEVVGLSEIPCIRLTHLTSAQRRAYVIADNKLAEQSGWDASMLRREVEDLLEESFDLDLLGFGTDELAGILGQAPLEEIKEKPIDAVPAAAKVVISRAGDVWQIGHHRLICGDSTDAATIRRLCDVDVDACWTDPPYNVAYESAAGSIKNDDMDNASFKSFLVAAFRAASEVMRPGAAIYVAHADTEGLNFRAAFALAGFKLASCLVWRKNSLVLGRSDYQWQHEPILYGWKPGAPHKFYGGRKQTTVLNLAEQNGIFRHRSDGRYEVDIGGEVLVLSGDVQVEHALPTIITHAKPVRNPDHPTMKPVDLIKRMLRNSAKPGAVVLDSFGGSGSTLMACEELGMRARLCELDERFCDVIVRRWQDYTGKDATLESSGETYDQTARVRKHPQEVVQQ